MENEYLFSFRLKSEKRKKRLIKEDLEKKIRKLNKRSREINKAKREIPLEPLEKPYQKGFVRDFVVRDDIKRSKDADFFENLLEKINTYQYSETRKFQRKRRRRGRKIYVDRPQYLETLSEYQWKSPKLGLSDRERQYFIRKEEYHYASKCRKVYYEFIEPWRYRLKISPNMITHYKPIVIEWEREEAEIRGFLDRHKNKGILCKKIYGGGYTWERISEGKDLFDQNHLFNKRISALEYAELMIDFQ